MSETEIPIVAVPLRIWVHGCSLPPKIHPKDPTKDRHRYLEIDDFEVKRSGEDESLTHFAQTTGIILTIKKFHISEYPIPYCSECLGEQGKRVYAPHVKPNENMGWCQEHYVKMMRVKYPAMACPICEEGIVHMCMGVGSCSHCDYTEQEWVSDKARATGFMACDTLNPESETQHNERRRKAVEEKEKMVDTLNVGDYLP